MKRFRHKLYNANNQLFLLNRGASLMIRVLIKDAPYSYHAFIMCYQLTSFNII